MMEAAHLCDIMLFVEDLTYFRGKGFFSIVVINCTIILCKSEGSIKMFLLISGIWRENRLCVCIYIYIYIYAHKYFSIAPRQVFTF